MTPISVNEVADQSARIDSVCIAVEGILCFEDEMCSLSHWPKSERRGTGCDSDIWIDPDGPVFALDCSVLSRWAGKRVVVTGIIEHAEPTGMDGAENGFGQFGLWITRIRARRIDLLKHWKNDHPEVSEHVHSSRELSASLKALEA